MTGKIILFILSCLFAVQQAWGDEYRSNIKTSQVPPGSESLAGSNYWDPMQLKDISLKWKPRNSVSSLDPIYTSTFRNQRVVIAAFTDARKNPAEIGKNNEKKGREFNLIVTTKDNVPLWLTDRFTRLLNELGIQTVKDNGTLLIEAEVLKFYVTEESLYQANVAMKIKIKAPAGRLLWEGMVEGTSKRFGRSYKEENYHESLGDACVSLVINFFKNEQVRRAATSIPVGGNFPVSAVEKVH